MCFNYHTGASDGPASVHLSGLVGHKGRFSCRLFCGVKGRRGIKEKRYYPALLKPHPFDVPGSDHPDFDILQINSAVNDYGEKLKYLLGARSHTDYKRRRRDTGISQPKLLHGLLMHKRLSMSATLCGDTMHLTTLNLGDLFIPLWRGTLLCKGTDSVNDWPWAVLTDNIWTEHGRLVAEARPYIPQSFDRPPRNIAEKVNSGYKSIEWQGYLFGLAPALLFGILPFEYWQNYCKLVFAVRILLQRSITRSQLQQAQKFLDEFTLEYELLYVQRRADRIHFVRPSVHSLIHLGLEVPRLGPPCLYSCWTMERTVGDLGREIRQPSNPYANLSERALLRAQVNSIKAMHPNLDPLDQITPPAGSLDLGDGYRLLPAKDRTPRYLVGYEASTLESYLRNCKVGEGNELRQSYRVKIVRWARVLLPTAQIARSAWKEALKPLNKLRRSRCVKVSHRFLTKCFSIFGNLGLFYAQVAIDGKLEFAEILFYFCIRMSSETQALAMVRLYSTPDADLYKQSMWTVYSVTSLYCEEGLRIIDIKSIISVVSMQPWHPPGRDPDIDHWFVWEKIGLDVGVLGGSEENTEEN